MGRKEVELLCPFSGELGPSLIQCGLSRGLLPYQVQVSSSSIQPFGHNRHEPKTGGLCPFWGGAATPYDTTSHGPRFTSVPMAPRSIQPLGHNRHGPKLGGGEHALFLGIGGSPSNTKSPEPRPTSMPSGILVHLAVWPPRTFAENWGGGCAPLGRGSWV